MEDAHRLDGEVLAFARRVTLHLDEEIDRLFPARSPARVDVHLRDGTIHRSPLTDPRGDPATALSTSELEGKLANGTRHVLAPRCRDALLAAIRALRDGHLAALAAALS